MNRLTKYETIHGEKRAFPIFDSNSVSDIFDKLAAYEDTGLEPEEVETLKAENAELKRLLSLAVEEIKGAANLICDIAKHDDSCPFFDYAKRQCGGTWRHADEAEKVLGGSENA